jgi:phosphatidylglycerophosphatase A
MFLATGGYTGRAPFAPGSFGSLVGIPIVFVLSQLSMTMAAATTAVLIFGAVWVAHEAERALQVKDPGCIVIDEIVGFCVTMLGLPFTPWVCVGGFILFRIFDIVKPPPVRQLEKHLPGGWGIVMDDVMAGIMANVMLRVLLYLLKL